MKQLIGILKIYQEEEISDKILRDKVFNIAKTPKYVGYKFFDKNTAGGAIKNGNILKKELAKELHKPINRKFEKRKVHPSFIDNI